MKRLHLLSFILAGWWCGTALAISSEPSARPLRVVSQTVGTDELLLALAEPEQIAALSHFSRESVFSAVAERAKAFPRVERLGDAESVLRYNPTLVLVANYSRVELVAQVRRAGVRVIVFEHHETLEDAFANLRVLACELGGEAPARAARIVADCEARVRALAARLTGLPPVRVIAPSTYGMIAGAETTFQDMCDHAGAINLAATLGGLRGHEAPPNEQMLTWPIDRVVVAGEDNESALALFRKLPPYQFMAAVRAGRVALIKPYMLSSVTHHRVEAYEMLARALHPEAYP
ncbi:MAG: ABC transporter substrate-binding protein [Opitutaceae bacterium]|nr:ABC transporter substrate-binding protein [Opitutaceae bacterium]